MAERKNGLGPGVSAPYYAQPDPTFDDTTRGKASKGGLGAGGVGMSDEDIKKARRGRTVKMGPGGEPYVE